jgi:predicted phosphodiesterase
MTRYLVLSDIHANIEALDAVLAETLGQWDAAVVLGDLVGYGGEPNAVVDRIREMDPIAIIRGNHDKVACGIDDAENFNQTARLAAEWTLATLTDVNREYLRALPAGPEAIDDLVEIWHGAPFDEDHYIFDAGDAEHAFGVATRPVGLFGHTHLPVVFQLVSGVLEGFVPEEEPEAVVRFQSGVKYLINPGSVGQPRDGDSRAAFAIYNDETQSISLKRVSYAVETAQRRIIQAGLPPSLANRLAVGR